MLDKSGNNKRLSARTFGSEIGNPEDGGEKPREKRPADSTVTAQDESELEWAPRIKHGGGPLY